MSLNLKIYQVARCWASSPEGIDYTHWGLEKDNNDIVGGLPKSITFREIWDDGTKKDVVKENFDYTTVNGLTVAKITTVQWYDLDGIVGFTKVFVDDFSDVSQDMNRAKIREIGILKGKNLMRNAEMCVFFTIGEADAFIFFELCTNLFVNKFVNRIRKDLGSGLVYELIDKIQNMTLVEAPYLDMNVSDLIIPNNSTAGTPVKLRDYLVTSLSS